MESNLIWKSFPNGHLETYHAARDTITNTVCAIWEKPKQIIVGINGYCFSGYANLEQAKLDVIDRLQSNRGIYLKYY